MNKDTNLAGKKRIGIVISFQANLSPRKEIVKTIKR